MTDQLRAPPVLSTPETHIFENSTPSPTITNSKKLTEAELYDVYEIARTVDEIRAGGWQRIALQFPDGMLRDAPRVFESLQKELKNIPLRDLKSTSTINGIGANSGNPSDDLTHEVKEIDIAKQYSSKNQGNWRKLFILADTSYGACCVDEIAAEHVEADVVVHYGRSCLSPTARLPIIYIFTRQPLLLDPVVAAYEQTFPQKDSKVILIADIIYSDHITPVCTRLKSLGYSNIFAPSIIHDPSSLIPNRTLPPTVTQGNEDLKDYNIFHISDPPASLLLTLSSRVQSMYIFPTIGTVSKNLKGLQAQTSQQLRRRYALLISLTTCSTFGILVNTLSVKNYLSTINKIQAQLAAAGKKSYTFVVGKVNAAKVANFSEIGGWVVVGCWESSLIESREFYRPIITPFELGLALMSDEERIWTGEWTGDFGSILAERPADTLATLRGNDLQEEGGDIDDEEDSAPPEFNLRTGRYVSHSRPMRHGPSTYAQVSHSQGPGEASGTLMKRANGDLATINGITSPGAEYLRSQRTWKGLGSDFEIAYENEEKGAAIEEGRRGVARGYTVGRGEDRK